MPPLPGETKAGTQPQHLAVAQENHALVDGAQPCGRLDQCIEHRLQVEGRAADDFENVSGRGLLLQGFAQLGQQPRVLDGNDSLGSEVLDEFDLLVGKGRTSCR